MSYIFDYRTRPTYTSVIHFPYKKEKNMKTLQDYIDKLNSLNFKEMYNNDFFWTWDKTDEELEAVFTVADALRFNETILHQ